MKVKKNSHGGPNDASHIVWASYRRCCLLQASPCLLIHQKYISISTGKTHRKKKFTHLGPRRREMHRLGTFLMFDSAPTLVVVIVELWWWCCCCTVVAVFVVVVVVEVKTECLVDVCMHINKVT